MSLISCCFLYPLSGTVLMLGVDDAVKVVQVGKPCCIIEVPD